MAYALVTHASAASPFGNIAAVTSAIDTSGATLLTAVVSNISSDSTTLTDSKGNTWVPLTRISAGGGSSIQIYYCASPIVGSGHTLTGTPAGSAYASIAFESWSGSHATPFDVENGNNVSGTPGSVTPSVDNCLVVQAVSHQSASSSITGTYTVVDNQAIVGGTAYGISVAYLIETTATATNPTWTTSNPVTTVAVFKPGAAAALSLSRLVSGSQAVKRASYY